MRILFVSSGNSSSGINPIIQNQLKSIQSKGLQANYYPINGKGISSFIRNRINLSLFLKKNSYDIVHAHYGVWGFIIPLWGKSKSVVSLMGSDVYNSKFRWLIKIYSRYIWSATICKSQRLKDIINNKNAFVIPNGVDFNKLQIIKKTEARSKLGLNAETKYVLFVTVFTKNNPSKNVDLAQKAMQLLNQRGIELLQINDVKHEDICYYYSACDLLLMTSRYEGSPNAIKEAMACNLPIVTTDVGDVREIIGDTEGCFIAEPNPENVSQNILRALKFGKRTNGRDKISYLDESLIADRIISVYNNCLKKTF